MLVRSSAGAVVRRSNSAAVLVPTAALLAAMLMALTPASAWAARGSWLGAAVEQTPGGLKVTRVSHQGPAERAGLKPGDVITALDGRPVFAPLTARPTVVAWAKGSVHRVTLRRGAQAQTASVRVERRPKGPGYLRLFLVHAPLPDFTLPQAVAPGQVALSKLRGKVVLVLFWASWCDVCKSLLPLLTRLHRRYEAAGLAVVAISRDAKLARLRQAEQKYGLPFTVAHDATNLVGKQNRVKVVPSLLFVDRRGVVRSYVQGAGFTYAQVQKVVRRMLRRRRPRPSRVRNDREVWL